MELPGIGKHCSAQMCNKLDFLPIKCDACSKIYCDEHYQYSIHNCAEAYKKNNQVPVCPLCNIPIPIRRGQAPDVVVSAHIDSDCQSDPARQSRKVFTNICALKGCKTKEVIPIVCAECTYNFCLKHRHATDHNCVGKLAAMRERNLKASLARQKQNINHNTTFVNKVQGNMNDDEALAKALALSMQDATINNKLTQEELDLALSRQLQASESVSAVGGSRNNRDRCNVS